MLTKCPECALQVSDKAAVCPHCGYPLKSYKYPYRKQSKKKRLPNGFGQISEIKGKNLRKPFRAMISDGKTELGRPIVKPLKPESYFATYNDAYLALAEYHRNPYEIQEDITLEELYEKWLALKEKEVTSGRCQMYHSFWKYCGALKSMPVKDIKIQHIKSLVESEEVPRTQKRNIKMFLGMIFDYGIELEVLDRNKAREYKMPGLVTKAEKKLTEHHIAFEDSELTALWNAVHSNETAKMAVVQCFSGFRPRELCQLRLSNINLEDEIIVGGMKTESGTDRPVPIHPVIAELVKAQYEKSTAEGAKYLFQTPYSTYRHRFKKLILDLGLNEKHSAHDCRVQFVTMAKKYNVDEYAIKYIIGHKITDLTEDVYTRRNVEWLKTEIEKIRWLGESAQGQSVGVV